MTPYNPNWHEAPDDGGDCQQCIERVSDRQQDGEWICADCETIKICRCGEEWCRAEWCALPLVGPASTADGFVYESSFRNCTCGSTLACPVWLETDSSIMRRRDRALTSKRRASQGWTEARWLLRVGWDRAVRG